jgi:hypothetical protein
LGFSTSSRNLARLVYKKCSRIAKSRLVLNLSRRLKKLGKGLKKIRMHSEKAGRTKAKFFKRIAKVHTVTLFRDVFKSLRACKVVPVIARKYIKKALRVFKKIIWGRCRKSKKSRCKIFSGRKVGRVFRRARTIIKLHSKSRSTRRKALNKLKKRGKGRSSRRRNRRSRGAKRRRNTRKWKRNKRRVVTIIRKPYALIARTFARMLRKFVKKLGKKHYKKWKRSIRRSSRRLKRKSRRLGKKQRRNKRKGKKSHKHCKRGHKSKHSKRKLEEAKQGQASILLLEKSTKPIATVQTTSTTIVQNNVQNPQSNPTPSVVKA